MLDSRLLPLVGAGLALLTAATVVGDVLSPVLLDRQPTLLLVLNARTVYLVALARRVPVAIYVAVAVARLCLADPLYFALGRRAGATRFRRRLPSPSSPLWSVAVFLSPTAKTMIVAGAVRMPRRRAAVANLAGTVARVVLIWSAGQAFPAVSDSLRAYAPWLAVPASVAASAFAVRHVASRPHRTSQGATSCRREPTHSGAVAVSPNGLGWIQARKLMSSRR